MWLIDRQDIGEEFYTYFNNIFLRVEPDLSTDLPGLIMLTIDKDSDQMLAKISSGKEIHQEVLTMRSYKSPSTDGMSVTFYKRYWEIVGKDVINQVQKVFRLWRLPNAFNHTLITLIPKLVKASKVDQYKSISLCNVSQ